VGKIKKNKKKFEVEKLVRVVLRGKTVVQQLLNFFVFCFFVLLLFFLLLLLLLRTDYSDTM